MLHVRELVVWWWRCNFLMVGAKWCSHSHDEYTYYWCWNYGTKVHRHDTRWYNLSYVDVLLLHHVAITPTCTCMSTYTMHMFRYPVLVRQFNLRPESGGRGQYDGKCCSVTLVYCTDAVAVAVAVVMMLHVTVIVWYVSIDVCISFRWSWCDPFHWISSPPLGWYFEWTSFISTIWDGWWGTSTTRT